jgi:hypothetical protein
MQDLEELLAQMADARTIYGPEPVAPYHGGNRGVRSEHAYLTSRRRRMSATDVPHQGSSTTENARDLRPGLLIRSAADDAGTGPGCHTTGASSHRPGSRSRLDGSIRPAGTGLSTADYRHPSRRRNASAGSAAWTRARAPVTRTPSPCAITGLSSSSVT